MTAERTHERGASRLGSFVFEMAEKKVASEVAFFYRTILNVWAWGSSAAELVNKCPQKLDSTGSRRKLRRRSDQLIGMAL